LRTTNPTVYLNEANFLGIAMEALPAAHKAILPDQSMRIAAHTAASYTQNYITISKTLQNLKTMKLQYNNF